MIPGGSELKSVLECRLTRCRQFVYSAFSGLPLGATYLGVLPKAAPSMPIVAHCLVIWIAYSLLRSEMYMTPEAIVGVV